MTTVTTTDGTEIFYKDWGTGRPVVFSHGWPLNADAWDGQLRLVGENGFRGIAHDRRGHGRSGQPWHGNDMNTYADDLAQLLDILDIRDAVLVGHSTGGGEVARYIGRHGTSRVSKALLLSSIPPLMLRTEDNPDGTPIDVFDGLRAGLAANRSQFYEDLTDAFYGFNRPGAAISKGTRDAFWLWSMQVGIKAAYDCVKVFSETDFTEDLKRFDVPTLLAHGDDDQIVPLVAASPKSAELIKDATLKIYPGQPHGLYGDHEQEFNSDLMAFISD
ncbi:alpha/beta fold hydrolase [Streptomyces sp. NPDC058653]|uniref:alpha/beta fold hydrolase n=1 Tax=Streptomyces sp. NPDC058653 TaxID=3346576 RepID=UPI0036630934